jgi:hypothetical protein
MNAPKIVLSLLGLSLLTGCAEPKPIMMKEATLTIYNLTSDKISQVTYKRCGSVDENVIFENIRVGHVVEKPLSVNCADFYAYDRKGKVVGKQVSVEMPPGLQWKITNLAH